MNAPLPGMDPYLEHPVLWTGVHTRLIVALANLLGPQIRPRYVATVEERVYLEAPEQPRIPDLWIQKQPRNGGLAVHAGTSSRTSPIVVEVDETELHEHYIEILDMHQGGKVVAVLELVSPSNKYAGPGRDSYLTKQRAILASTAHLIEIDLLRYGPHVLSIAEWRVRGLGPYDYLGCVNRASGRKRFELYPCLLRERLPVIQVPLVEPDADVRLDLQAALEQVYNDGDYMLRIHYDEPCEPPLSAEDQAWANERWLAYKSVHAELFPPSPPPAQ